MVNKIRKITNILSHRQVFHSPVDTKHSVTSSKPVSVESIENPWLRFENFVAINPIMGRVFKFFQKKHLQELEGIDLTRKGPLGLRLQNL